MRKKKWKETKSTFLNLDSQAEYAAQKVRREAEEKAREEAKKQKVVEKKEKKKRTLEYLQWLQDKVLEEEATLLEEAEKSQIVGSKCKEITTGDEEGQQLSKKAKERQLEKYCGGATVKMGDANPCERYISTKQDCLVHPLR